MSDAFTRHVSPRQTEPAREDQVKNSAGGFTFGLSDYKRLDRFLTLGTEGGTFYVSERDLTRDNAGVVERLAKASDPYLISRAEDISTAGRAPRNGPALFALAAAAGLGETDYRQRALDVMPSVARTGHHLLDFVEYAELFRGWGPQLVRGVRNWYTGQPVEDVAYQVLKYKQRDKWSQRDLMRLAARKWKFHDLTPEQRDLFAYVMKGETGDRLPLLVHDAARAHATRDVREWVSVIRGNRSLSWEMLPSEALAEPEVWRALVENGNLPLGALLRNLGRMTSMGLIKPMDSFTSHVASWVADERGLAKARVHPVSVLLAMKTYASGHGLRGKGQWTPVMKVTDALDAAFYAAFQTSQPSGKRTLVALDVSGSMGSPVSGLPLSAREVAGAMAMTSVRMEPEVEVMGFASHFVPLNVGKAMRLDSVVSNIARMDFGSTDCALPMVWAAKNKIEFDVFQVWTDNETWAGSMHPHVALERYRQSMGIPNARLQVCGVTATEFSIADPLDHRQLDVAGFDAAVPRLLADHARGDL